MASSHDSQSSYFLSSHRPSLFKEKDIDHHFDFPWRSESSQLRRRWKKRKRSRQARVHTSTHSNRTDDDDTTKNVWEKNLKKYLWLFATWTSVCVCVWEGILSVSLLKEWPAGYRLAFFPSFPTTLSTTEHEKYNTWDDEDNEYVRTTTSPSATAGTRSNTYFPLKVTFGFLFSFFPSSPFFPFSF